MSENSNILIKNIYYMLSYAFSSISKICDESVAAEDFDNIQDLFSVILYKGISNQVKRGLNKEYLRNSESLSTLRGKINITDSIKQNTQIKSQLVCEYDEFSENTLLNQILKSACLLLIKKGDIKKENKKNLKKLMLYFSEVGELNINNISWKSVSYHRNNSTYKMLINICYLVVKGLLISTQQGEQLISKHLDDQHMHRLYEKFVLEYYKKHCPKLNAKASMIEWDIEAGSLEYLPNMKSDITLSYGDKTLIIDTKFYSRTMQTHFDKPSIISSNLYQIFTYVKNKDKENTGNVSGMLLYAKTNENITPDNDYVMSGNKISVKTLDLNQDWQGITTKLNSIAQDINTETIDLYVEKL